MPYGWPRASPPGGPRDECRTRSPPLAGVVSGAGLDNQLLLLVGFGGEVNMAVGARLGGRIGSIADVVLVAQVLFDVRENPVEMMKGRHLIEAAPGFQGDLFEH